MSDPALRAATILEDAEAEALFKGLAEAGSAGSGAEAPVRARSTLPISQVWALAQAAESRAAAIDLSLAFRIGAARGTLDLLVGDRMDREPGAELRAEAELEPGADRFSTYLADLRGDAVAMGSQLTVTDGLAVLSAGFDAWGKPGHRFAHEKGEGALRPPLHPQSGPFRRRDLMAADPRTGPPEESRPSTTTLSPAASAGSVSPPARYCGRPVARGTWPGARSPSTATSSKSAWRSAPMPRTPSLTACSVAACTENCFSAVKTDQVVLSFRHAYAQRFGRGFLQRRVFRSLLPRPRLMRGLVRSIWALRKTGLADAARRVGLVGLLNPKLERAIELRAGTPGPLLSTRLARRATSSREGRPLVGYWMSCGYNYVLPEVGEATVRVLERLGMAVEVLDNCCCGLAAHGYGDREAAAKLARENLRRIGDLNRFEAIVSECGSCPDTSRSTRRCWPMTPEWSGSAARLKDKVRSFSEFVVERGGLAPLLGDQQGDAAGTAPVEAASETGESAAAAMTVVTYHDPCHLGRRYQNVVAQPRQLLRSLPGVEFREATESDACCGAAGTYGVLHPETSASIIERKMGFIRNTRSRGCSDRVSFVHDATRLRRPAGRSQRLSSKHQPDVRQYDHAQFVRVTSA